MDEQFHRSLSQEALRPLLERSDHPAWGRFLIQYGLLWSAAGYLVLAPVSFRLWWLTATAILVFAWMTMGLFALVHESAHNTAFRSRGLNHLVCWLAAFPIYYVPTGFREFHFTHHRYTHDPTRDPEISIGGKPAPSPVSHWAMYLGYVSGLPLLFLKLAMLVAAAVGIPAVWQKFLVFVSERHQRAYCWEARLVLAFHLACLGAGWAWWPGMFQLLGAQLLGHAMLSGYLMSEHHGLPHEGTILERTRTTHTTPWLAWLMWNMPYHGEHHAYPAVPFHALPQLGQLLDSEKRAVGPSYVHFHQRVWGALLRGRAFVDTSQ